MYIQDHFCDGLYGTILLGAALHVLVIISGSGLLAVPTVFIKQPYTMNQLIGQRLLCVCTFRVTCACVCMCV